MKEVDEKTEKLIRAILQVRNIPRNLRNNNPGNLIYEEKNKWKGMTGTDGRFCQFHSMAWGFRAFFRLMHNYNAFGRKTLRSIIVRYAPSNENDTEGYIKAVSAMTGIPPEIPLPDPLQLGEQNRWCKIALAFCAVESGIKVELLQDLFETSEYFPHEPVSQGWLLAKNPILNEEVQMKK